MSDRLPLYKYSTFWPRFCAGFIDGLILSPVSFLDNYLNSPNRTQFVLILWAFFSYSAYWIYSVSFCSYSGQTIGKKAQDVKVLDLSEKRIPSFRQALLRDVGSVVSSSLAIIYFVHIVLAGRYRGMDELSNHWIWHVLAFANLGWFLLEITTMLTNSKRRALHDIIAGTVVVRTNRVPALLKSEVI